MQFLLVTLTALAFSTERIDSAQRRAGAFDMEGHAEAFDWEAMQLEAITNSNLVSMKIEADRSVKAEMDAFAEKSIEFMQELFQGKITEEKLSEMNAMMEEQNKLIASIVEGATEAEKEQAAEKAKKDVAEAKKFEEAMMQAAEEAVKQFEAEVEAAGGPEALAAKMMEQFEEARLEDFSERRQAVDVSDRR